MSFNVITVLFSKTLKIKILTVIMSGDELDFFCTFGFFTCDYAIIYKEKKSFFDKEKKVS